MDDNILECPKCRNVLPRETEKCYKCGFRLGSFLDYMEAVDAEINRYSGRTYNKGNNNIYEFTPVRQNNFNRKVERKNESRFKRLVTDPLFIVALFLVIAITLGIILKQVI